jgi:1-acyl-sn-glycerol-3-phosphate acyltransferase
LRSIYSFFFKLLGWKIIGSIPSDLKQYVMVVAPHTSNWDFMVGLAARSILGIDTRYVGKKELFRWPFGWLFRKLGGYPVDRSKNTNFVDAVADLFKEHKEFSICLTPEGTRSYAPNWKTGFYYIALKAGIPVLMVGFDYSSKSVVIEPPFHPSGDIESDIEKMKQFFRKMKGKIPEKGVI